MNLDRGPPKGDVLLSINHRNPHGLYIPLSRYNLLIIVIPNSGKCHKGQKKELPNEKLIMWGWLCFKQKKVDYKFCILILIKQRGVAILTVKSKLHNMNKSVLFIHGLVHHHPSPPPLPNLESFPKPRPTYAH